MILSGSARGRGLRTRGERPGAACVRACVRAPPSASPAARLRTRQPPPLGTVRPRVTSRGHQQLFPPHPAPAPPPCPGHPDSWLRDKAEVRAELTASFSHWIFQKRERETTARLLLNNRGAEVGGGVGPRVGAEDVSLNDFLHSEAINRTGSSPADPLGLKQAALRWSLASLPQPSSSLLGHPDPTPEMMSGKRPGLLLEPSPGACGD